MTSNQASGSDLSRLLAAEPAARSLARHLVATDGDDVVQQAWLRALQHRDTIARPQPWLLAIVRRLASNLRRGEQRRREHERTAAVSSLVPSSAELAIAEERRRALVAAVDQLPDRLRTVVMLRWFEGMPPRRIATELGVTAATVSTQLQRAYEQLRARLDRDHGGDRRAWLLPLVPLAARPLAPSADTADGPAPRIRARLALAGVGVAAMVAAVTLSLSWPPPAGPATPMPPARLAATTTATADPATTTARQSASPLAASTANRGTVVVRLSFADDHSPVTDRVVSLRSAFADWHDAERRSTDATGMARFDDVPVGRHLVVGREIEVRDGSTVEVAHELERCLTLRGIVRDAAQRPIAGAAIEVAPVAAECYPEVLARTAADGRFEVRGAPPQCVVDARADGFLASPARMVVGQGSGSAAVEFVLGANGGAVEGSVLDHTGAPVADAAVIVGSGDLVAIGGVSDTEPLPAIARTDAAGHFRATGIAPGEHPVRVRARDCAPLASTCIVVAAATTRLQIVLDDGATIAGTVRTEAGAPLAAVAVEIGTIDDDHSHFAARTDASGAFLLRGLPADELALVAHHAEAGNATVRVVTIAGRTTMCELQLARGLLLHIQALDDQGHPVSGVRIECFGDSTAPRWGAAATTDTRGQAIVANCPPAATFMLYAHGDGFDEMERHDIDPSRGVCTLQLQRAAAPVVVVGTVIAADGAPVANARVSARLDGASRGSAIAATDGTGRFELRDVPAGRLRVHIDGAALPDFTSPLRDVAPGTTWDLAAITLPRGGVAVAHVHGDSAGMLLQVGTSTNYRRWPIEDRGGRACSKRLWPGAYVVFVGGDGIAAQAAPIAIRDDADTVVDITPQRGTNQTLLVSGPGDTERGAWLPIRVHRRVDGDFVAHEAIRRRADHCAGEIAVCLAPGDYELRAVIGNAELRAPFSIGAVPTATLQLSLQ